MANKICKHTSKFINPHLSTVGVGDRAFPVATARTWNSLPQHVTSAPSMSVFRGRLKWRLSSSDITYHDSLPQLL